MTDKEKAIEFINRFINDESKKTLLIKGYDDDAKVREVLYCLNKEFDKGIIRTSDMSEISNHINRAFNKKILPNSVISTESYEIGKMKIKIGSYINHTQYNPKGEENTFTIFFPIQTMLNDAKKYNQFLDELNKTGSRKIILITTNDHSIKAWDIINHVDEVFLYSVENDNAELMNTMRTNGVI